MTDEIENLTKAIKVTYKALFYCFIFLLIPSMGFVFTEWKPLIYFQQTGLSIAIFYTWRINRAMKKKEEEKNNERN